MKLNKIYNMDAVVGLKELPSNSADCIIIDPPYNIGKDFGNNKTKMPISDYVQWAKEWLTESKRILKPSGTMFVYGFSEILAHISVNLDMDHRWLVWHYTNKTVPSLNFWQRSHESIICAWKDKDKRIFNRDDVREPYTDNFIKGYSGANANKKRPKSTGRMQSSEAETFYKVDERGALPRDVLKQSALAGGSGKKERIFYCRKCKAAYHPKEMKNHKKCTIVEEHVGRGGKIKMKEVSAILKHPTQKPIDLTTRLIKSCMPDTGVVLIPFAGSGSEAKVAKDLGHQYIGFEINEEYFNLINFFINN